MFAEYGACVIVSTCNWATMGFENYRLRHLQGLQLYAKLRISTEEVNASDQKSSRLRKNNMYIEIANLAACFFLLLAVGQSRRSIHMKPRSCSVFLCKEHNDAFVGHLDATLKPRIS
ncbi:hypothetical protein EDC96DRAFT_541002 [Choanephora cucurbitarum]|nr:hypothetical protein EDC96DRAFT_541002 [Choanephora cucurbitarum]